jgi:hypothetical protein
MARKNDGACANPKPIRTDLDCRAARPKFNEGAWSPAKISDVTGGGLYLFATPDESSCPSGSALWLRRGCRPCLSTILSKVCARQRTFSSARSETVKAFG